MHGYPPFQGRAELREAIAAHYRADHGVELDPEREVAVVPGTKTAIMLAVLACADAGQAVALPDPGYPDYLSAIALAGARRVALALDRRRLAARLRRAGRGAPRARGPQLPVQPVRGVRGAGDVRGRRRVGARARQLAAQRPRLRLSGLRRAPGAQRPRDRRGARGGRRAVVAVEGLRHGRLAGRLRRRQRRGRRAHPRAARPSARRRAGRAPARAGGGAERRPGARRRALRGLSPPPRRARRGPRARSRPRAPSTPGGACPTG